MTRKKLISDKRRGEEVRFQYNVKMVRQVLIKTWDRPLKTLRKRGAQELGIRVRSPLRRGHLIDILLVKYECPSVGMA
jgi:hypothetical protein